MARLRGSGPPALLNSYCKESSEPLLAARQLLHAADYVELHKIERKYDDGVLTLHGIVTRYYLKQRAYHVVANLSGVKRVANEIAVQSCAEHETQAPYAIDDCPTV